MKSIFTIAILAISFQSVSQTGIAPVVALKKMLGGSGNDYAIQVRTTPDGGYITAGYSNSTDIPGVANNGASDYYVVKLDAAFNIVWQKMYGGTNDEGGHIGPTFAPYIFDFENTSDGGFILCGRTGASAFGGEGAPYIIKLDGSGNVLWTKSYAVAGFSILMHNIEQSADGGYIAVGEMESSPLAGRDYYILKTDAAGNEQWHKRYGDPNDFTEKAFDVCQTTDGNYIVVGSTTSPSFNNILKLNSTGDIIWDSRNFPGNGNNPFSVSATSDGGCAILTSGAPVSNGGYDLQLFKMDVAGTTLWQHNFGGSGNDFGYSLKQTTDGGFILGGSSVSADISGTTNNGGTDMYFVHTDATGTLVWQTSLGGANEDDGRSIRQTATGYVVDGWSNSSIAGTTSHGGFEYLVMTLEPPAAGPLPVHWISVDATSKDKMGTVKWVTADEVNVQSYQVYKSVDAVIWQKFSTPISAKNTSGPNLYQTTDAIADNSGQYFRVEETDIDGKKSLSKIVYLKQTADTRLEVYPNPSRNSSTLKIIADESGKMQTQIYTMLGQLVYTSSESLNSGVNLFDLPIALLKPGLYQIRVSINESTVLTTVLTKQ